MWLSHVLEVDDLNHVTLVVAPDHVVVKPTGAEAHVILEDNQCVAEHQQLLQCLVYNLTNILAHEFAVELEGQAFKELRCLQGQLLSAGLAKLKEGQVVEREQG